MVSSPRTAMCVAFLAFSRRVQLRKVAVTIRTGSYHEGETMHLFEWMS